MNHGMRAVLKQMTGPMRCVFVQRRRCVSIGTYLSWLVVCVDVNET